MKMKSIFCAFVLCSYIFLLQGCCWTTSYSPTKAELSWPQEYQASLSKHWFEGKAGKKIFLNITHKSIGTIDTRTAGPLVFTCSTAKIKKIRSFNFLLFPFSHFTYLGPHLRVDIIVFDDGSLKYHAYYEQYDKVNGFYVKNGFKTRSGTCRDIDHFCHEMVQLLKDSNHRPTQTYVPKHLRKVLDENRMIEDLKMALEKVAE